MVASRAFLCQKQKKFAHFAKLAGNQFSLRKKRWCLKSSAFVSGLTRKRNPIHREGSCFPCNKDRQTKSGCSDVEVENLITFLLCCCVAYKLLAFGKYLTR